jgi:hypothetical protein
MSSKLTSSVKRSGLESSAAPFKYLISPSSLNLKLSPSANRAHFKSLKLTRQGSLQTTFDTAKQLHPSPTSDLREHQQHPSLKL